MPLVNAMISWPDACLIQISCKFLFECHAFAYVRQLQRLLAYYVYYNLEHYKRKLNLREDKITCKTQLIFQIISFPFHQIKHCIHREVLIDDGTPLSEDNIARYSTEATLITIKRHCCCQYLSAFITVNAVYHYMMILHLKINFTFEKIAPLHNMNLSALLNRACHGEQSVQKIGDGLGAKRLMMHYEGDLEHDGSLLKNSEAISFRTVHVPISI
ncbi:hypothetical protein T4D_15962 [Trichinella pseudospiralis]|uniref:Uncharacterized protein n=1 Tax=Trichinella pseudospiralis TaxID=6337 RepID=A0A0V1F6C6_TRIPS|nr:hypothetical protein T4D_15962 [Trichinella pseudospiralis]